MIFGYNSRNFWIVYALSRSSNYEDTTEWVCGATHRRSKLPGIGQMTLHELILGLSTRNAGAPFWLQRHEGSRLVQDHNDDDELRADRSLLERAFP